MVSQDRPGAPSKAPAYSFGTRTPTSIKDTVKGGVLLHDGWAVDRQVRRMWSLSELRVGSRESTCDWTCERRSSASDRVQTDAAVQCGWRYRCEADRVITELRAPPT